MAMAVVLKISPSPDGVFPQWFVMLSALVIPVFGILTSDIITKIIVRERAWQAWYAESYNELGENAGKVFPINKRARRQPNDQQPGYMASEFIKLRRATIAAWGATVFASLCFVVGPELIKLL